jgi:murein tripeptide amidase MpaA
MPTVQFDRFYRYEDLTRILHAYAEEHPDLVQIESIGESYEGRDVWLLTVTNAGSGPAGEKPALWIDGNIHATEISASTACLYFVNHLVTAYGDDPDVTRCLDTRAFYICPRVNPDGAELAMADEPRYIRSSTRPYPYEDEPIGGLVRKDVDGDGRMLSMRIPDPNGAWKVSSEDPRLMVRRDPTETGGEYYRLLPEGTLENYDGVTIAIQPRKERLDLNRNFPERWRQEYKQKGAGPYPTSEPEVHNLTQFIAAHPNITGGVAFHTYSGVLLRPYEGRPDKEFIAEDLWTYKKIGEKGTSVTGYPNVSVYHDFRYHPNQIITGGFDTWLYEQLGMFAWTVEIWSPQRQAGIEDYKFIDWYREHPVADDLALLTWSDEVLDGKGYVDWYPFEHPQLGEIELGGWDKIYAFRNPPPPFLEDEVARFPDWLIWHLLISPRLELYEADVNPLGDDAYRVRLVVHNTGWLPTYVTKKALEKKVVRGIVCEIELPENATLETGKPREKRGQLEGRAYVKAFPESEEATKDRLKVTWTVRAPNGGEVNLIARHPRAGTISTTLTLA